MRKLSISGRVDSRMMQRLVAAASLKVGAAYGIGADAVAEACRDSFSQNRGFVETSVRRHCRKEDRSITRS